MKLLPFLVLVAGSILIGMSPIYVRLSELGPVATAFYRVCVAVPFFLTFESYRISRQDKNNSYRNNLSISYSQLNLTDWLLLLGLGLCYALNLITWHWSLGYIYVANATLLANLSVLFVIPLGWILFNKRVEAKVFLYALGAFGGVIMLSWGALDNLANLKGLFWGILSAVFYALYILSVSKLREKLSAIQQMTWTCIFTSLWLLPFVIWQGESLLITSMYGLIILVGLGITSQVMGQGFIAYSLAYIAPALATLILLLQPVVAATMGWLIFNEVLTTIQIIGGLMIMIFIYLARNIK